MGYNIKYQMQVHDGPRTMEQQLYLLAKAAKEVAENDSDVRFLLAEQQPTKERVQQAIQALNRELNVTDLFMSGYHEGEKHGETK